MTPTIVRSAAVALLLTSVLQAGPGSAEQNWTNYVRIGAYGLGSDNAERIVRSAQEDGVFGLNCFPEMWLIFARHLTAGCSERFGWRPREGKLLRLVLGLKSAPCGRLYAKAARLPFLIRA